MSAITIENVSVSFQTMGARDLNLKRTVFNVLSGRRQRLHEIQALREITLSLSDGDRLALVGDNGAGKSTLLSVVAGMLPASTGKVATQGRVLSLLGGANTGLMPDDSGQENAVTLGVKLGESPRSMRNRLAEITEFSGLGDRMTDPVYSYSTGMAARLRMSVITSLSPDILLLDEGIGTADAQFNRRAQERIAEFMGRAGIVVMASHSPELLMTTCTSGLHLDNGTVVERGPLESVLQRYLQAP